MSDQAQWFDKLGKCMGCGKPAIGQVMSMQNHKMGPHCEKCAAKRIKTARVEREKETS